MQGKYNLMEIKRFFDELAPRLKTARVLEHELDRNLARRFNVLDYLKTNELGLSRIIADLFNPEASHGQGALFLRTFLANFKSFHEPLKNWPDLDRRTSVVREQRTEEGRQIDVVVEIHGPDGKYCLAIENKPYAHDQENQVKDYLEYLEEEYEERFLLIYLSPTGEEPSEWSIHKDELNEKWKGRFAIMPYYRNRSHEEVEDELNDFRLSHSLADWLGESRKNCDVERLRWFLRDAETFCQRKFGGQTMTTDIEADAIRDFVMSDQDNMRTAVKVYESWPAIRKKVCWEFFKQLYSATKQAKRESEILKDFVGDLPVDQNYKDDTSFANFIGMYRTCWVQYKGGGSILNTHISLSNQRKGPNGWYIGVFSPMPVGKMVKVDKERRQLLERKLKDELGSARITPMSPWGDYVEKDRENWYSLVPELHKECQDNGGEITSYFVNTFIEIAEKAIPIINEIETGNSKT